MNKSTVVLLGVLIVLGGIAFLLLQQPGEQSLTESAKERFLEVDSADVIGVAITSPSTQVSLARSGGEWVLDRPSRYRADQKAVGDLIRQIQDLSVNSVISENPEKQSVFQVDSTGTTIVVQTETGDTASFILGKTGPAMTDVYARREGSHRVVLVDAAISLASHRPVKDWRDHTITEIPNEEVTEIAFQYGDTTFTLTWSDSAWSVDGQPANEWTSRSVVATLSDLDADDFLEAPPSPMPRLTATLSFAGMKLYFHESQETDRYIVTSSTSSQWFQIERWRANQVLKRKKDLLLAGN